MYPALNSAPPEMLFTRGFALYRDELPTVPGRFERFGLPAGGYTFAHDTNLGAHLAGKDTDFVLLAGYAIDLLAGCDAGVEIAQTLLDILQSSEAEFFEHLDALAGRFIVVYSRGGQVRALSDASAMKSIFYVPEQPGVIASHPRMLSAEWTPHGLPFEYGFPGVRTPCGRVAMLSANTLLDLADNSVVRFFPRRDLEPQTVEAVAAQVMADFATQMKCIKSSHYPIWLSLTAGIDSRFTLACLRPWIKDLRFFTFHHTWTGHDQSLPQAKIEAADKVISAEIASRLGLSHTLFDRLKAAPSRTELDAFQNAVFCNTYGRGSILLNYWYNRLFGAPKSLHIRSNVAEIGRCFWKYRSRRCPETPFTTSRMAALYASQLAHPLSPEQLAHTEVMFEEFRTMTGFDRLCNYDADDMFYWEHRLSAWHSQFCVQSDVGFESHVLFNARRTMKALLSVPLDDRKTHSVFLSVIRKALPELADLPINPVMPVAAPAPPRSRAAEIVTVGRRLPEWIRRPARMLGAGYVARRLAPPTETGLPRS